jgi:hypothetical protein
MISMNWWDRKALSMVEAQRMREIEYHETELDQYTERDVKRVVIRTSMDVIALNSYLSSLNSQIRTVKWILFLIAGLFVFLIVH